LLVAVVADYACGCRFVGCSVGYVCALIARLIAAVVGSDFALVIRVGWFIYALDVPVGYALTFAGYSCGW
jgi:hypothetical protein